MTPDEQRRYSRQICLPGVGGEGQERLQKARVLLVGLGGLGSPVALYLAAAGVGTLGLADFDRVELHNLHRQILHDSTGLGRSKLESARARLLALNPDVHLELHAEGVTLENALELFARYDLIVDGSDNFGTRYLNNDAAFLAGKPLLYGSIFQFEGQVAWFDPARGGPCYRCMFPEMPDPARVPNCAEAGVFGALCGVVGSLQAMEVVKRLTGVGELLEGRMLTVDVLGNRSRRVRLVKDPGCPLCGAQPRIRSLQADNYQFRCEVTMSSELPEEISTGEARGLRDALWLDVREAHELAVCRLADALHIPLRQVSARKNEVPRDRHVVVLCHHGVRSLHAARLLRQSGWTRVQSLRGGIDRWALEIDPGMARY